MASNPLDDPHTLTVTLQCASAVAAYDTLETVVRIMQVDQSKTSDDFPDDHTIIPVGTVLDLKTRSKANPIAVGTAVVTPT